MRIDYINTEIMDTLLNGYPVPKYAAISAEDGKHSLYIVTIDGFVAYVLEPREVYFNLDRCHEDVNAFKPLQHDGTLCCIANKLEPTADLLAARHREPALFTFLTEPDCAYRLLSRFKGAAWDTFVNVDLLEAFDAAEYYQSEEYGPIAVVEDGALVGYVMPVQGVSLPDHYTDSPTSEEGA